MSFPAFFDTNVLYRALLNDFILELADRGLFRPLWSKDVLFELSKNLVENGEDPALVEKRVGTMERYFSGALVTGYEGRVRRAGAVVSASASRPRHPGHPNGSPPRSVLASTSPSHRVAIETASVSRSASGAPSARMSRIVATGCSGSLSFANLGRPATLRFHGRRISGFENDRFPVSTLTNLRFRHASGYAERHGEVPPTGRRR
ncbi:PIN domain-containing protein [Gryllotalpicola sp.]|uniref:PIN domain-containing protein n=1 Tax=Gryllotalpicola sp. TaxID=1932787 RepID=UPI00262AA927|nr:PIN domain-containing protein [Gryllotalpicola sp.]